MEIYLEMLLNVIVNQFFEDSRCLLIFQESEEKFVLNNSFLPLVHINPAYPYEIKQIFHHSYGCQGIIIHSPNPIRVFNDIESQIKYSMESFSNRRYLIIESSQTTQKFQDFLSITESQYVRDILFLSTTDKNCEFVNTTLSYSYDSCSLYKLSSNKFVGPNPSNDEIVLKQWDSKQYDVYLDKEFYPNKVENLYGRQVKVATFTYKPYSIPIQENISYSDGMELNIALLFSEVYNMTLKFVVNEDEQWGNIFNNGSGNGILGNVLDDKADFGIGALFMWEFASHHLDPSYPTFRTGITCLVPAPSLAANWVVPLLPFTFNTWFVLVMSFLTTVFTVYCITYHKKNNYKTNKPLENSFFFVIEIYLGQSVKIPKSKKQRIVKVVVGCIFLQTVCICMFYSSGLASSLTIPRYEGAIHTIEDLAKSNIFWMATHDAWVTSILTESQLKYKLLVKNFRIENETYLAKKKDVKVAYAIERLGSGYYAVMDFIDYEMVKQLRVLREDLYWEYTVIWMKKSSVFKPLLDDLILKVWEAGFIQHWNRKVTFNYLDGNIQHIIEATKSKEFTSKEPVKLRWEHVRGIFALWTLGVMFSVTVFLLEINILNQKAFQQFFHKK